MGNSEPLVALELAFGIPLSSAAKGLGPFLGSQRPHWACGLLSTENLNRAFHRRQPPSQDYSIERPEKPFTIDVVDT